METLILRLGRRARPRLAALVLLVALVAVSCGGSGAEAEPPAAAEEPPIGEDLAEEVTPADTPAEVDTPPGKPFKVKKSSVSATLGAVPGAQVYGEEVPFEPGSVAVHWYQDEGFYVAVYAGFSADEPVCAGNENEIRLGTHNVANSTYAPTSDESVCKGKLFENLSPPAVAPRLCDGLIVYRTDIPTDAEGALWAWLEIVDSTGELSGANAWVAADAASIPAIDYDAPGYIIPGNFLPDGTSEVTC